MYTVTTKVAISDRQVADMLITAFEGGSNYWCEIVDYENPDNVKVECKYGELPLTEKGAVIIRADYWSAPRPDRGKLTKDKLSRGLSTMASKYPHQFRNVLLDNGDAETADVFLQCCVFGEIVYG